MKIVIDIPKKTFEEIQERSIITCGETFAQKLVKYIRNGTPLPTGHGRLIECEPIYDKLIRSYRADEKDYPERGKDYRVGLSNAIDLLIKAPTIIEGSDSE